LRRTKAAVLTELPARTDIIHRVELGREQRDLYESVRVAMDERVRTALAGAGLERSRVVVLDALLKLRQACCDPSLLALPAARKVNGSAKREELLTLLRILPEIERNGDLAEHIARRAARGLGAEMSPRSRGLVERMGEVCSSIWRAATDAILDDRIDATSDIEDIDDEIDELHVALTAELVSGSMSVPVAVEVAMTARFYERFGDHCVNLARRRVSPSNN
jgi:SNF2 family DNA or RNA helicase